MSKSKTSSDKASKKRGVLIIVSAPSGCGKTTLVDRLLKRHPDWVRSVSMTTRAPRPGEKKGDDYIFVTPQEFQKVEAQGGLLESAKVFDHSYGTPKDFVLKHLQQGENVICAIDVQGTKSLKKMLGNGVSLLTIFILPPSVKILRERLENRKTESPGEVQHRIEVAQDEIKEASKYDFTVVNQTIEQTVLEMEEIIDKFEKKGD